MPYRLPSYKTTVGEDCPSGTAAEPCWGDVEVIDDIDLGDDSWVIYGCSGHGYHPYRPSDRREDQGVTPVEVED